MVSTRQSHGNYTAITWQSHGNRTAVAQQSRGDHVVITRPSSRSFQAPRVRAAARAVAEVEHQQEGQPSGSSPYFPPTGLQRKPAMVEFFAGEAGVSAEFANVGYDVTVHERDASIIRYGQKLPKEQVKVWVEDFIQLDWERQLLGHEYDFAWCGNDCRTFGPLGCTEHGRRKDNSRGSTAAAFDANKDLERTCQLILRKCFTPSGTRTWFTFAIENPSGKMKTMDCVRQLIEHNEHDDRYRGRAVRATVVQVRSE
jgi:hypothetical protein